MSEAFSLPDFDAVLAAARRLEGVAHRTPVLRSSTIDARLGAQIFFKCENLQRGGAFKFRGAYNALASLDAARREAGVIAYSSGNHAQAIALSGRVLSIPTTIVMPDDAPAMKVAATRGYGAEIVTYDRYSVDREALGARLAAERGLTLVPPFDAPDVIAGQGTAALELFDEVGPLDVLFVCVGGGGLVSGCALATRARSPECRIVGVEPAAGNDVQLSLEKGEIVRIPVPKTIADGAQTQAPGKLTFSLIRSLGVGIETVTDAELVDAMRFFAERMKLIVEPTGCLGAAAAFSGRVPLRGMRAGVILSGGNVDMTAFCRLLSAAPATA